MVISESELLKAVEGLLDELSEKLDWSWTESEECELALLVSGWLQRYSGNVVVEDEE